MQRQMHRDDLKLTSSDADARLAEGVDCKAISSSAPKELQPGPPVEWRPLALPWELLTMPSSARAAPAAPSAPARAPARELSAGPMLPWSDPALLPAAPSAGCRGVDGWGGDKSTALPSVTASGWPTPAVSVAVNAMLVPLPVGLVMTSAVGSIGNRGVCTAASARQAPSLGADTAEAAAASVATAADRAAAVLLEGPAAASCRDEVLLWLSTSGSICMAARTYFESCSARQS